MSWRHFNADTAMAIRRYWQDEPDGGVTVATEQDVEAVVDNARAMYGQHSPRSRWTGDMHQVATIPLTIFMELHRQGIAQDQRALRKWVNNSDNSAWRTRPGRI